MSCFISSIWAIEIEDVEAARDEMGTLRQAVAKAGLTRRFEHPLEDSSGYTRAADLASSVRVLLEAWVRHYHYPVQRNAIFRSVYDQVVFLMNQVGLDAVDLGEDGYDGLLWEANARLTAVAMPIYDDLLPAVRNYAAAVQAGNEMAGLEAVLLNAVTELRNAFFTLNDDEEDEDEESEEEEESDEEESDEDSEEDSEDEDSEDEEGEEDDTSSSEYTTDTDSYTSTDSGSESEDEESSEEEGEEEQSSDSEYQTANGGDDWSETSVIYYGSTEGEDEEEEEFEEEDNDDFPAGSLVARSIEMFNLDALRQVLNGGGSGSPGEDHLVIQYHYEDDEEGLDLHSNNSTQVPLRRAHSAERFWVPGGWGIVLTSGYQSN